MRRTRLRQRHDRQIDPLPTMRAAVRLRRSTPRHHSRCMSSLGIASQIRLAGSPATGPIAHGIERSDQLGLRVLPERRARGQGNGVVQGLESSGRVTEAVETKPSDLEGCQARPRVVAESMPKSIEGIGLEAWVARPTSLLRHFEQAPCRKRSGVDSWTRLGTDRLGSAHANGLRRARSLPCRPRGFRRRGRGRRREGVGPGLTGPQAAEGNRLPAGPDLDLAPVDMNLDGVPRVIGHMDAEARSFDHDLEVSDRHAEHSTRYLRDVERHGATHDSEMNPIGSQGNDFEPGGGLHLDSGAVNEMDETATRFGQIDDHPFRRGRRHSGSPPHGNDHRQSRDRGGEDTEDELLRPARPFGQSRRKRAPLPLDARLRQIRPDVACRWLLGGHVCPRPWFRRHSPSASLRFTVLMDIPVSWAISATGNPSTRRRTKGTRTPLGRLSSSR